MLFTISHSTHSMRCAHVAFLWALFAYLRLLHVLMGRHLRRVLEARRDRPQYSLGRKGSRSFESQPAAVPMGKRNEGPRHWRDQADLSHTQTHPQAALVLTVRIAGQYRLGHRTSGDVCRRSTYVRCVWRCARGTLGMFWQIPVTIRILTL